MQRDPNIWRIAAQRFAEKSGGSNSNYSERMALDEEARTHYGGIPSIGGLPDAMAEHGYWLSRRCIVIRRKNSAAECAYSESVKIISCDVLGAQRSGGRFDSLTPDTQTCTASLESGDLFEFRRFGLQPLVQRIRKHSPAILRTSLHTAIVTFADSVESSRIRNGQRAEH